MFTRTFAISRKFPLFSRFIICDYKISRNFMNTSKKTISTVNFDGENIGQIDINNLNNLNICSTIPNYFEISSKFPLKVYSHEILNEISDNASECTYPNCTCQGTCSDINE